jgi:hypothetical protein
VTAFPNPERAGTVRGLERRFKSVENATRRVLAGAGAAPGMLTLLSFSDDPQEAARAFAGDLREHFREARPDLYVEVLEFPFPRPRGLKAAWSEPRFCIDYQPTQLELLDLRPDLRPPPAGVTRADWNPDG